MLRFSICLSVFVLLPDLSFAHHSASVQFAASEPELVVGRVVALQQVNPHAVLIIERPGGGRCAVILGSPSSVLRSEVADLLVPGRWVRIDVLRPKQPEAGGCQLHGVKIYRDEMDGAVRDVDRYVSVGR